VKELKDKLLLFIYLLTQTGRPFPEGGRLPPYKNVRALKRGESTLPFAKAVLISEYIVFLFFVIK